MRARSTRFAVVVLVALLTALLVPVGASAFISTGDGGWVWQTPLPQGNGLNAVDYVDASRGWAVGYVGTILTTADGGSTWSDQYSGSTVVLRGVSFADATHGWAVGDSGTILATTDGGAIWVPQDSGSIITSLASVCFVSATKGWAVGGSGTILATSDGGSTWTPQSSGTDQALGGVTFVDATHGWAVGRAGTVLRTTNGGSTWTLQTSATTEDLCSVSFIDASHGWAAGGGEYSSTGTIVVTADGGATWAPQACPATAVVRSISFGDATHGWAVTWDDGVLGTSNGGATWTKQGAAALSGVMLSGVCAQDGAHACVVGLGGALATTANGGTTWTKVSSRVTDDWVYSVCAPDAGHGWAVDGAGRVLATADGGAHWAAQYTANTNCLKGVDAPDATHAWAVGAQGTILATADGGGTWTILKTGSVVVDNLSSVCFVDATHGWMVGNQGIQYSSDGGHTWTPQTSPSPMRLWGVTFVDLNHGWAVGYNGAVVATTNGGTTWTQQSIVTGELLNSVSFADANHGWAIGDDGAIIGTSDGGLHWNLQNVGTRGYGSGIAFADATHGWAAGGFGILATTTGGWVPPPALTLNAPATGTSWVRYSRKTVDWTASPAVTSGTFRLWATPTGGGAEQAISATVVPAVAGQTFYSLECIMSLAPGTYYLSVYYYDSFGTLRSQNAVRPTVTVMPSEFTITPSAGAGGTISPGTPRSVAAGGSATYAIAANTGYHIARVLVDGNPVGAPASYTFTNVTADHTIAAEFAANPAIAVTAPTAASRWPSNTTQSVRWTLTAPVGVGEFRVWLVSAGGTWYIGKQVPPVAGQTVYSTQLTTSVPAGSGYKAYVYWRPTAGSGSWLATARSAAFTVTSGPALSINTPIATSSWPSGSTQTVSWTLATAAASGEFKVWLVSSTGSWYVGKQVLPVVGAISYSTSVTVSCPAASGYKAYVYWRPTVGSGGWAQTAQSAAFTVTPVNITSPAAGVSWPLNSAQTIRWTINPTVAVGEFKVWLVSAAGAWYFGKVVPAVNTQSAYTTGITLNAAGMTAGSYKAYVYYRPTAGTGGWTIQTIGAPFSIVAAP